MGIPTKSNLARPIKFKHALRMEVKDNIFGCFMKIGFDPDLTEQDFVNLDKAFTPYIWGERGINNKLKKLKHEDYGKDIEPYRSKEKAIGIPIIVTDENFFSKSEEGRYTFLKQSILQKLELLAEVVKKKKLDTNMEQLKSDLQKVFT